MKVLELCLSGALGGLELYAYRCAATLNRQHEVLGVISPAGRLCEYFDRDRIPWRPLETRFRPLPLGAARQLAAWIDEEGVDAIHMHWGKDLALAALAKRLSRRKPRLIYTRQMQITRPKRDAYHRLVWQQVDRVVAITEKLAGHLRGFLPQALSPRVTTLYYGVDAPPSFPDATGQRALRREFGLPEEGFLVGLLGRIKESKGQHLLVDAIEQLNSEGKTVNGLIVGRPMEPAYLQGLKQRVLDQGLPITFQDFTDEPQRLMQACDVVVLASEEETFGLVLAEAMRAGVAVVGSRAGGVMEIIDHERTGLMFTPRNAGDLARQLKRLGDDPVWRRQLAEAGKAKGDRLFDPERHFGRLIELIESS